MPVEDQEMVTWSDSIFWFGAGWVMVRDGAASAETGEERAITNERKVKESRRARNILETSLGGLWGRCQSENMTQQEGSILTLKWMRWQVLPW